jgi:sec-independent protein translocase protein TatB
MLNLDPAKLLVIGVVAIILLGPDKLPQVARQVGGAWRSFNDFRHRMESEVRSTIPDLPSSSDIARLARSPSALLTHLSNMAPADGTPPDPEQAAASGNGTGEVASPAIPDGTPITPALGGPAGPPVPAAPHPPEVAPSGDPSLN